MQNFQGVALIFKIFSLETRQCCTPAVRSVRLHSWFIPEFSAPSLGQLGSVCVANQLASSEDALWKIYQSCYVVITYHHER